MIDFKQDLYLHVILRFCARIDAFYNVKSRTLQLKKWHPCPPPYTKKLSLLDGMFQIFNRKGYLCQEYFIMMYIY